MAKQRVYLKKFGNVYATYKTFGSEYGVNLFKDKKKVEAVKELKKLEL